jgi:hypothetical protein
MGLWVVCRATLQAPPTLSDGFSTSTFCGLHSEAETVKVPRAFMERLTDALCYAA